MSTGGSLIHWSAAELAERRNRIEQAIDFWNDASAARHHPGARLNIAVNYLNGGAPVTVPNAGTGVLSSGAYVQALKSLGYDFGTTSGYTAARRFDHETRLAHGTDWAWTVFVKPYYGTASAYLNGPLVNANEDDPAWTYAHEFAHISGARDAYGSARTTDRAGYLYTYNSNAANLGDGSANPASTGSLLKTHGNWTFSDGALGGIGWTDSDSDTVPDILDTLPAFTADTAGSDADAGLFQLDIDARVTALPSPHPSIGDITIKRLVDAEYRLDGGDWLSLLPEDGGFGDFTESFALTLPGLVFGEHAIDVRITDSVDNFIEERFAFVSTIPEPAMAALLAVAALLARCERRART